MASHDLGNVSPPPAKSKLPVLDRYKNVVHMFRSGSLWIYTPLSLLLAIVIALAISAVISQSFELSFIVVPLVSFRCQRSWVDDAAPVVTVQPADVTVVDHVKLFRNRPEYRFEGRIHEQILEPIQRTGATAVFWLLLAANWGYELWREADKWRVVLSAGGNLAGFDY